MKQEDRKALRRLRNKFDRLCGCASEIANLHADYIGTAEEDGFDEINLSGVESSLSKLEAIAESRR